MPTTTTDVTELQARVEAAYAWGKRKHGVTAKDARLMLENLGLGKSGSTLNRARGTASDSAEWWARRSESDISAVLLGFRRLCHVPYTFMLAGWEQLAGSDEETRLRNAEAALHRAQALDGRQPVDHGTASRQRKPT